MSGLGDYFASRGPAGLCCLTIEEAMREDGAVWSAVATSSGGRVETRARLTVRPAPPPPREAETQTGELEEEEGTPPPRPPSPKVPVFAYI